MNTEIIENDINLFEYNSSKDILEKDIIADEDIIKQIFSTEPFSNNLNFYLKTESQILQLVYAYNKILSLSNSRTRILAHQVESTDQIINSINQRFLIADEVGLGKTIEAGLVIKELIYRYNYSRILIVTPASLMVQWQLEMQSKFNEEFLIMDRKLLTKNSKSNTNAWKKIDKVICSLDFIKNDKFREDLENTKWDAVIFDEAHRLRRDSQHITHAYNIAEVISKNCESLLLLSATPFRGKLEELYFLIALLDKNVLGPFNTFCNDFNSESSDLSLLKKKLSEVVIRRTKKEIGGFTKRFARTIKFELYPEERLLYDETTSYVREEFNRALQTENRAIGFVMTVFQKLLDSSTFALHSALCNRLIKLEGHVERANTEKNIILEYENEDYNGDEEFSDDLEETTDYNISKTIEELKFEIKRLKKLIKLSEKIKINKKGENLQKLINSLYKKGNRKFLIFTQFRTTQKYIAELLSDYEPILFYGSMDRDEKEEAIEKFKNDSKILIATEAGGEGRNMQFCNIIINYDLPWSPLRIEQRVGRLHRFGQSKDVYIYNFSTAGTVAERILEVLTDKLKLFEESMGAPDILLGQFEDELNLDKIFMEFVSAGKKDRSKINLEISERIEAARKSYSKLADLTLINKLDLNYDEYYEVTLKERQFSNSRIERFVELLRKSDPYVSEFLGEKYSKNGLYPVKKNSINRNMNPYGTFSSKDALNNEKLEFLAFGHNIINLLFEKTESNDFNGTTGMKIIDFHKEFSGMIFFYIVQFKSVKKTKKLIPVIIENSANLTEYEVSEAERESLEQDFINIDITKHTDIISEIKDNTDYFFSKAKKMILLKVKNKVSDMTDDLDIKIDPELDKIKESYNKRLVELNEKLELQKSKMKWYGKDMKSSITRTKNLITKAEDEMSSLLNKYNRYTGIESSIKLLNAGIIISN